MHNGLRNGEFAFFACFETGLPAVNEGGFITTIHNQLRQTEAEILIPRAADTALKINSHGRIERKRREAFADELIARSCSCMKQFPSRWKTGFNTQIDKILALQPTPSLDGFNGPALTGKVERLVFRKTWDLYDARNGICSAILEYSHVQSWKPESPSQTFCGNAGRPRRPVKAGSIEYRALDVEQFCRPSH